MALLEPQEQSERTSEEPMDETQDELNESPVSESLDADAPSPEPIFEQSVLGLKEFDNDQLMTMNPASGNHQ